MFDVNSVQSSVKVSLFMLSQFPLKLCLFKVIPRAAVLDQVLHNQACTATEDGSRLAFSGSIGINCSTI